MKKHVGYLLVACSIGLLALASGPSGAGDDSGARMPEFEADYELRRNNTRAARLTRRLQCADGECRFESEGQTVGIVDLLLRGRIEEWTTFSLTEDGGFRPREYYYRQRARGDNNEYARLFFNPDTGRVSSRGDKSWEQEVEGEAMDELLSQLRLMMAVRAGEERMSFSVVDSDGDLDRYDFVVVGRESVSTPAGTFEAVKVERERASSRRITTMWFAPELEYMPIIVRHERVGRETYTATLKELTRAP